MLSSLAWPFFERHREQGTGSHIRVVLKSSRDAVEAKLEAAEARIRELEAQVTALTNLSQAPVKLEVQVEHSSSQELRLTQAKVEVLSAELAALQARLDALSQAAEAACKGELKGHEKEVQPLLHLLHTTQDQFCQDAGRPDQANWARTRQLQALMDSVLSRVVRPEGRQASSRTDLRQAAEAVGLPVPDGYGQPQCTNTDVVQVDICVTPVEALSAATAVNTSPATAAAVQVARHEQAQDHEAAAGYSWQHDRDSSAAAATSPTLTFSHSSSPVCHMTSSVSSSLPDTTQEDEFTSHGAQHVSGGAQQRHSSELYTAWSEDAPVMYRNMVADVDSPDEAGDGGDDHQGLGCISDRLYNYVDSNDTGEASDLLGVDLDKYQLAPMEPPPDFLNW